MANFVALHNRIHLGHLDLTSKAYEVKFGPLNRAMKPCTTYADGGFACVLPGLVSGQAGIRGYQDYAVDVLDDEISIGQLGSQYAFSETPNPTGTVTAGDACWFGRGLIGDLNPLGGMVGEVATFDIGNFAYDTAIVQGKVAAASNSQTADGNGTAVTLTGPTASQKLYAALHVFAYSGFTSVVFKIQSDDSGAFSSATDRITFTTVTGRTSEFASVAGNFSTETHHRITWDVTGTGSVTFAAEFGVI